MELGCNTQTVNMDPKMPWPSHHPTPEQRPWTGCGSHSGWSTPAFGVQGLAHGVTSGMPAPPEVDMEELEDSVVPVYMRESVTFRAYLREKQRQADLERMGLLVPGDRERQVRPKWQVGEVNYNAWRENTIDNRTIYNLCEAGVSDGDRLPPKSRPPSPPDEMPSTDDVDVRVERTYIFRTRTGARSADAYDTKNFWAQTIKQYNRPLDGADDIPYRSPRAYPSVEPASGNGTVFMQPKEPQVESITKVPSSLKSLPRKLREHKCKSRGSYAHEFCDVLGPSACRICIEFANRKIAGEVQRAAFPELDCTVTTLVAPKLAKFMALGDRSLKFHQRKATPKSKSKVKQSILKLPTISDQSAKFGRAGIERTWERNAKVFHAANNRTRIA